VAHTLLVYAALVAAPTAAFVLARRGAEWLSRWGGRAVPPAPLSQRLADLTGRLRRLDGQFQRLERSGSPGDGTRLRAVGLGYDDTLRECCLLLDLPDPGPAPLAAAVRVQVEADLAHRGLEW